MEFNGFDSLDLSNVEAGSNHLKAGQYRCQVTAASVEPNKARNGMFVKVEMKCLDGHGIAIDRFNVKNQNPKAVEIGLQKLKKFLIESGHSNPDKPGEIASLIGLKVGVNLKQGSDFVTDTGQTLEGRGEITGYFGEAGAQMAGPAMKTAAPAASAAPAGADSFDDEVPF
nr:hypothetical protein [Endozoicomonas sp.]